MEALLKGLSTSAALDVLRSLLDPLREFWGDADGFVPAAAPQLVQRLDLKETSAVEAPLKLFYQDVMRVRALYFRPISDHKTLENLHRQLDARSAHQQKTVQQGALWLAMRIQQSMLDFLASDPGKEVIKNLHLNVQENRGVLLTRLGDPDSITMSRVNGAVTAYVREVMGAGLSRVETAALSGYLVEALRAASRHLPDLNPTDDETPEQSEFADLTALLGDVVHQAEVNDSKQRFNMLPVSEKTRRYEEFQKNLVKYIRRVAPYAVKGFEGFCQAVESVMFPYPTPMDYIRNYAKPIYNNGRQSSLFGDVTTQTGVKQRYIQLSEAGKINRLVLEIAYAVAMGSFRRSVEKTTRQFLLELNVQEEFGWPSTISNLKTG